MKFFGPVIGTSSISGAGATCLEKVASHIKKQEAGCLFALLEIENVKRADGTGVCWTELAR